MLLLCCIFPKKINKINFCKIVILVYLFMIYYYYFVCIKKKNLEHTYYETKEEV